MAIAEALASLREELQVEELAHGPDTVYRRDVATNLFRKVSNVFVST